MPWFQQRPQWWVERINNKHCCKKRSCHNHFANPRSKSPSDSCFMKKTLVILRLSIRLINHSFSWQTWNEKFREKKTCKLKIHQEFFARYSRVGKCRQGEARSRLWFNIFAKKMKEILMKFINEDQEEINEWMKWKNEWFS